MVIQFNNNQTLYEELSKKDSPIDNQDFLILEYQDSFEINGSKSVKSKNLGEKFASINSFFFDYLKEYHIPSAYVKNQKKNALKFVKYNRFPFVVKVLNITDKRTAKIFGKKENEALTLPVFEYHYSNGRDNLISESHLISFDLCTIDELKIINRLCSKINAVLKSFFERRNTVLAEFFCSFGKADDKIYLVDDFTPQSIKIILSDSVKDKKWIDPYKLNTSADAKKYTDYLYNVMSL